MVHAPLNLGSGGHSADVQMHLHVNGSRIALAQMGGRRLVFRQKQVVPHERGVVVMTVDGREHRWEASFQPTSTPVEAIEATLRSVV